MTISADMSEFDGKYTQSKDVDANRVPSLTVTANGRVFGAEKEIQSGSVNITTNGKIYYNNFNIVGAKDDKVTFTTASTGGVIDDTIIKFTGESATATFTNYVPAQAGDTVQNGDTVQADTKANYELGNFDMANGGTSTTIIFENSNIVLTTTDYSTISAYQFNNSVIDMQKAVDSIFNQYNFAKLNNSNSTYKKLIGNN